MPSNKLVVWIELRSGDQKFASALVRWGAANRESPAHRGFHMLQEHRKLER
jgi:hypothetical protein